MAGPAAPGRLLAVVVDHVRRDPDVAARHRTVRHQPHRRAGHQVIALPPGAGRRAMRQVILERAAVRLERGEVRGMEVQVVAVRHDDAAVPE